MSARLPAGLGLCLALTAWGCTSEDGAAPQARLSLVETLAGADTSGYERAVEPRAFDFPRDHGPHPTFRTEWWYVTGNLTGSGRDFGFQLTFFRSALAPRTPGTESRWGTNQAYMAHFAVTDVAGEEFHAFERFARGSVGLAGASAEPLRVWLEDWTLEGGPADGFPMEIRARAGGPEDAASVDRSAAGAAGASTSVALRLTLDPGKPPVFHGDRGLSQKGPEPGNASLYYAYTRMPARGEVVIAADTMRVNGFAWLDREWSTSALAEGQVGWDWFALQLDDGWDLMIYQLRLADGSPDPLSDGALIDPEGRRIGLRWGRDVELEPLGRWTSPVDGAVYPAGWRIRLPQRGWDLTVEPRVANQELDLAFRYWEGAVGVRGRGEGGDQVSGRGYVELTGYAGTLPER